MYRTCIYYDCRAMTFNSETKHTTFQVLEKKMFRRIFDISETKCQMESLKERNFELCRLRFVVNGCK